MNKKTAQRALRKFRKENELCNDCGKPSLGYRCTICHNRHKAGAKKRRDLNRANGICIMTGCQHKALHGFTCCKPCKLENIKTCTIRRKLRQSLNICLCGKERLTTLKTCKDCWLRGVANTHLGSANYNTTKQLKDLWNNQNGLCALTHEILVEGVNASIDHIEPSSKGGAQYSIKNLQWVTKAANAVKAHLTSAELFKICKAILHVESLKSSTHG